MNEEEPEVNQLLSYMKLNRIYKGSTQYKTDLLSLILKNIKTTNENIKTELQQSINNNYKDEIEEVKNKLENNQIESKIEEENENNFLLNYKETGFTEEMKYKILADIRDTSDLRVEKYQEVLNQIHYNLSNINQIINPYATKLKLTKCSSGNSLTLTSASNLLSGRSFISNQSLYLSRDASKKIIARKSPRESKILINSKSAKITYKNKMQNTNGKTSSIYNSMVNLNSNNKKDKIKEKNKKRIEEIIQVDSEEENDNKKNDDEYSKITINKEDISCEESFNGDDNVGKNINKCQDLLNIISDAANTHQLKDK